MSDFRPEDRHMLIETHTLLKQLIDKTEDHETRIRTVENRQTKILTFFTFISAVIGSAASKVWDKVF